MPRVIFSCVLLAAFVFHPMFSAAKTASSGPVMEPVPVAPGEAPRYRVRTPPSRPAPTKNIYEILEAGADTGKFAKMVDTAGLKPMFADVPDRPITVFVPTDNALDEIPSAVMKRIYAGKASLQSFVEYHVISGSIVTAGSMRGHKLSPATASGEELAFDGTDKKNPPKVGGANLAGNEISATNGVVHIVDGALVPPSLLMEPKAPPPRKAAPPEPPTASTAPTSPQAPATDSAAMQETATASESMKSTATIAPQQPPIEQPVSPAPAAAGERKKGFTLFGHTFGW